MSTGYFLHEVDAHADFTPGEESFEVNVGEVSVRIVRTGLEDGYPAFIEYHGEARHGDFVGILEFQSRCVSLFSQAMGKARRVAGT